MRGWVKIHRSFLTWEWFDKPEMVQLFIYLLLQANHDAKEWHGITIERGQIVTSIARIAQDTRLSPRSVRTCLNRLKATNEVTIESTSQYTIVTISKYDTYQDADETSDKANDKANDKRVTNERQSSENQTTTNKNDKNYKNDKNIYTHTDFINLVKSITRSRVSTCEQVQAMRDMIAEVIERVGCDPEAARAYADLPLMTKAFIWNWGTHLDLMSIFTESASYKDFSKICERYELDDVTAVIKEMANKLSGREERRMSFATTFDTFAQRNYAIQEKKRLGNPRYN
jgi:hypothetical protein